jgi:hypothetical protein
MAVRAWLKTAMPPMFGKEMVNGQKADFSDMGIGPFCLKVSENNGRIL